MWSSGVWCSVLWKAGRLRLKCNGTRAETRFRLSAKLASPLKSAGSSVQSTTGSRGVRISGSNAGYTMFRCSGKSTGYPLRSPVSPSLPLPCVTVCHHISVGLYHRFKQPVPRSTYDKPITYHNFRSPFSRIFVLCIINYSFSAHCTELLHEIFANL